MRAIVYPVSVFALTLGIHAPGWGQATANAAAGATDAFGFRTGDDAVGIYDESSVRGFNLEAAGNYRIDGTYFVRNSGVSSFFLESTTVRIGYNTLNSILPGPSGVVDYRLRDPARDEPNQLTLGLDAYAQPYLEVNLKHRDRDGDASYSIGLARVFDIRDLQGGKGGDSLLIAGTGRLSLPWATARVFGGEYQYDRPGQFRVAAQGDTLPPKLERGRFLGQRWAMEAGQRRIAGLLVDAPVTHGTGIGATAVFSQEDPTRAFTQVFSALAPDATSHAVLIATPQQRSTAWSGELRAHGERSTGGLAQRIDLTVRGRLQRARFGGSSVIDLGNVRFGDRPAQQPPVTLAAQAARLHDRVNQFGIGVAYRATLHDRLRINLGLLRTDYRKAFTDAAGVRQASRSKPWLYNAGGAWRVGAGLELYGSYSRGLEEAGVAPATATNRNQVLDAIEVTQREFGLRYVPREALSLVLAGFDTRKPYAGIDGASGAYRFLGEVRHRGVEASLSGKPVPGLSVVLGGVYIDPRLSGAQVDSGRIARRPVGVPRLRAIASIDYALPMAKGVSVDASATFVGARPARSTLLATGDQFTVGALTTFNLGLRYRFDVADHSLVLRAQLLNALGRYGWEVNSSETLAYNAPRRLRLVLTTPF